MNGPTTFHDINGFYLEPTGQGMLNQYITICGNMLVTVGKHRKQIFLYCQERHFYTFQQWNIKGPPELFSVYRDSLLSYVGIKITF